MKSSSRNAGFTLVELMIVVLIIAIIASIAIPSYSRYVVRSYRAAARACMMEYSQFMERSYTTNLTYVAGAPAAPLGCATESDLGNRYTMAVGGIAARTYSITATPIGSQLTRDAQCGVLTLDQAGVRGEGGTGTVADCW
jgi:type IV pilus assembly protein PilE